MLLTEQNLQNHRKLLWCLKAVVSSQISRQMMIKIPSFHALHSQSTPTKHLASWMLVPIFKRKNCPHKQFPFAEIMLQGKPGPVHAHCHRVPYSHTHYKLQSNKNTRSRAHQIVQRARHQPSGHPRANPHASPCPTKPQTPLAGPRRTGCVGTRQLRPTPQLLRVPV
jgi:hypothetical protein